MSTRAAWSFLALLAFLGALSTAGLWRVAAAQPAVADQALSPEPADVSDDRRCQGKETPAEEGASQEEETSSAEVRTPLLRNILGILDKLLAFTDRYSQANGQESVSGQDRKRLRDTLVDADVQLRATLGPRSREKILRANQRRIAPIVRPQRFLPMTPPKVHSQGEQGENEEAIGETSHYVEYFDGPGELPPGEFEPLEYLEDVEVVLEIHEDSDTLPQAEEPSEDSTQDQ